MTEHVQADELRVTVEMGDDYEPSDRLATALSELQAALADTDDDDEVVGFEWEPIRSFTYTSVVGGSLQPSKTFPKVELDYNKIGSEVFKF